MDRNRYAPPGTEDAEPIVIQRDVTADLYFAFPPSAQPQHLIDGLLYICPLQTREHHELVEVVYRALREFAGFDGGFAVPQGFECRLSDDTVVQPDAGYVAPARRELVGQWLRGAPDLAVEVLSVGTAQFDTEAKFAAYGRHGVREAWFIDPVRSATTVVFGTGIDWVREQEVPFGASIPSEIVHVGAAGLVPG